MSVVDPDDSMDIEVFIPSVLIRAFREWLSLMRLELFEIPGDPKLPSYGIRRSDRG
jgi:hypothetical protein